MPSKVILWEALVIQTTANFYASASGIHVGKQHGKAASKKKALSQGVCCLEV